MSVGEGRGEGKGREVLHVKPSARNMEPDRKRAQVGFSL
jgi:hypothetical protein